MEKIEKALPSGAFLSEEEYFNRRVNCEVERRIVEATDWEQRRWELAKYLYELDYDTSTPAKCMKKADKFIEEYKKSLNTEERL